MLNRYFPILLATFFLSIIGCKTEKQSTWVAKNIEFQRFEVQVNRDTTLRLKSGALLRVKKNSFLGVKSRSVHLKVQEIENMENVLRSRVSTLTTDGKPLSTFYMVNIGAEEQVRINPEAPLSMTVPATNMATDICVYRGEDQGDQIAWTKTDTLKEQPIINRIAEGRALFEKQCASCHASNLCFKLTGPPLACIEGDETVLPGTEEPNPFASREWLIEYTKNSQAMIKRGDPRALQTWNEYKPTLMTSFEGILKDDEIHKIYDYIKERSTTCKLCMAMTDYYTFEDAETEIEVIEPIERKQINLDRKLDIPTPSIETPTSIEVQFTKTYTFDIPDMSWYNIDRINEPIDKVENFTVTTNKPGVYVNMVLPEYRIQLSLKESNAGVYTFDYAKNGKVDLPLGAKGMLLARTDEGAAETFFGGTNVQVQASGNTYSLELKPGREEEINEALSGIGTEKKLQTVRKSQRKKQMSHSDCSICPLYGDFERLLSE
jgi:Cytochrome C oxidase, cbb3-type, subunit III